MSRGKQATKAANRRHGAALEHIRLMTEELTTYRLRARDAEALAQQLQVRLQQLETECARNDALVKQCAELIESHRSFVRRAQKQWYNEAARDFGKLIRDALPISNASPSDAVEFFDRRYPRLAAFLGWSDFLKDGVSAPRRHQRFDAQGIRVLGRALGERMTISWDPERDAADVMNDMLDVGQMRLSAQEKLELLDVPSGPDLVDTVVKWNHRQPELGR